MGVVVWGMDGCGGGGGGLERCRWRGWMDGWMDGECADILGLYYVKSIDLFGFFG